MIHKEIPIVLVGQIFAWAGDNYIPIRQLRAAERVAANAPTVINQGTLFITYNVQTRNRESYKMHI